MEKLGYPKRDLMVTRVKAAKGSQEEAKEQFKSALEHFSAVLNFHGGTLQDKYEKLQAELDRSESKASDVKKRIAAVEAVSEALFDEWEGELRQYQNQTLRKDSERKLDQTRTKYEKMISAMRKVESKLDPALQPLRDDVLFLKHNLNAQAIASLNSELTSVEGNVTQLVRDLERSIIEADKFIDELGKSES